MSDVNRSYLTQPQGSDYEEARAEFEHWFRNEGLGREHESDMWYAWRACWVILRKLIEGPRTADKGNKGQ
jgi:hypothetical protein